MKVRLKPRKTAVRRFKVTGTGKLVHGKTGLNHLMRNKDKNRRRNLLAGDVLYKGNVKRVSQMLGLQ
ncbi:MAG: 50S ribosomal protein L35 [Chthonomonadaceae bacterium]|nr:50S ribosomal protein L35 [Chthonomonadaceae bacterium]